MMLGRHLQRSGLFPRLMIVVACIVLSVSLAQAQRPRRPAKPVATQVTHNSITITWDEASNALMYHVLLKGRGWNEAPNGSPYTFTGLKPKKKYTIRVRYIEKESFAKSRMSKKIVVRTKKKTKPAPILPIDIQATLINSQNTAGEKAYVFSFSAVSGAVQYEFYQAGGHPKLILNSPEQLQDLELVKQPAETVTVHLDAFDADGEKIAAGSVTVTFPAN